MKQVTSLKYCGWVDKDCPHIGTQVNCDQCKKQRDREKTTR